MFFYRAEGLYCNKQWSLRLFLYFLILHATYISHTTTVSDQTFYNTRNERIFYKMNTRKISKLANELIMDELLGTGQNDESNFPKDILDELEFAFQDCQRKVDQLHDDPHALANLGVLKHNGTIRRILITQEEADIIARLLCLMQIYSEEG